ncbi:MAG: 2-hydroxyacid dehydrogenase [Candidatus Thorarchaeota archaeon]
MKILLAIGPGANRMILDALKSKVDSETFNKLEIDAIPPLEEGNAEDMPYFSPFQPTPEELIERMDGCDILVVFHAPVNEAVYNSNDNLKLVVCPRGGPVNIDLIAAEKRGVHVINAPGHNGHAVTDHVFALLLSEAKNVVRGHKLLTTKKWEWKISSAYQGLELDGKKLGIAGFGSIGRLIPPKAQGFGLKCIVYDPFVSEESIREAGCDKVDFETLLKESDFITIHIRLTKETVNLFSREQFEMMKPTAYLINTSRGPVINEDALHWALTNGKIAGAGLDVYWNEPINKDNPLIELENITLTPHIAYIGTSYTRGADLVAEDMSRFLRGEDLRFTVSAAAFQAERDLFDVIFPGRKNK